jgi:hypothetical protein
VTGAKIKEACARYRAYLERFDCEPKRLEYLSYRESSALTASQISHVLYMLDDLEQLVDAGRLEKAFRWLGFIQGWLWARGLYSIDELKEHNKP